MNRDFRILDWVIQPADDNKFYIGLLVLVVETCTRTDLVGAGLVKTALRRDHDAAWVLQVYQIAVEVWMVDFVFISAVY